MAQPDEQEYSEWFANILKEADKFHDVCLKQIKSEHQTYDELLETAAHQAVTAWVTTQTMLAICEKLKQTDSDKAIIEMAMIAGMTAQKKVGAMNAVNIKLANDPKQKEKAFIFKCWQDWQKSPAIYASKAAFSKDMMTKCEHLQSQKKVEDWCREWEKTNHTG